MKFSTICMIYTNSGGFVKTANTRNELINIIKVPIHSRNERGNWNVPDPDAANSLEGIDATSIPMRSEYTVYEQLVANTID